MQDLTKCLNRDVTLLAITNGNATFLPGANVVVGRVQPLVGMLGEACTRAPPANCSYDGLRCDATPWLACHRTCIVLP
jgi:hypothetical protein